MKLANIGLYEGLRYILNGGIFGQPIADELAPKINELVLDFGCGTGAYSQIIPGRYVGLDLNQKLIQYARYKYGSPKKRFLCGSLKDLWRKRHINIVDKGIIVNVLHHMSDVDIHENLRLLKKLVKKRLIIVDMDKNGANLFQKLLFFFDDGHFIRSQSDFINLICPHFAIKRSFIYFSTTKSVRLCLFFCVP